GGDYVLKALRQRAVSHAVLKKAKQSDIPQYGVLYYLRTAAKKLLLRQCVKRRRVADHTGGLPERSHLLLAVGKVYCGLAAHRRVHHSQKGGGKLEKLYPTLIGRRRKAGQIPDDSPSQRNKTVASCHPEHEHGVK